VNQSPWPGQTTPTTALTAAVTAGAKQIEPKVLEKGRGAGKTAPLAFTAKGNRVSFKVPLEAYEMVVISTKPR